MTAYRRGADFERRVKQRLEEQGWTVFRTAGSHSPADLVAVAPQTQVELCSRCEAERLDGCGGAHLDKCLEAGWARHAQTGTRLRLVQCKSGRTAMTKRERAAFRAFAEGLGAEAVVFLRGMKQEAA